MVGIIGGRVTTALIAGMAAAGIVMGAPIAGAEPGPAPGGECPPQDAPNSEQQECGQPKGPDLPDLPDPPRNPNENGQQQKQGRLSDTNCWMFPSGPYWNPPGAMPPPSPPGVQVWPCYYVLGLQPTVAGT